MAFGVVGLVALTGACTEDSPETDLQVAQAQVTAKENALADAQDASASATEAFCDAGTDYVEVLDRYGDVLTTDAATVGDVVTGGSDLREPKAEALSAAEDAQQARQDAADAQAELDQAKAELAAIEAGTSGTPAPVPEVTATTPLPIAPADVVDRVKVADSELSDAQKGISDDTPLVEASIEFNSAAVALEMAWLRLLAESGCFTEEERTEAQQAAAAYTTALQQQLTDAGYYTDAVDGIYGPATVAAVKAVQEAHGLPVTGVVDKATDAALRSDLVAKGGTAAAEELAATAALQQTLHLAGYWDGPVDGEWSEELEAALKAFQKDLGVEQTGVVDPATVAAFQEALAAVTAPEPAPEPEPEPEPEPSESEAASS